MTSLLAINSFISVILRVSVTTTSGGVTLPVHFRSLEASPPELMRAERCDLRQMKPECSLSLTMIFQDSWRNNRKFSLARAAGSLLRCEIIIWYTITVALVLRDHVLSEKLGPVVDRMRYGYRMEYEKCLSTVLEKNPHHDVQALTCLALAQFLQDKLRMIRLAEDRPELADCYEIVFGKDFLPALQRLGQAGLATRIESLFKRAAKEYGDVKFRSGTIGETAKSELYDIRHLGVGKVAPDIVGKDQDGKQFKLSDHRGKVVLLYFWSEF